jgi:hypothetical protein
MRRNRGVTAYLVPGPKQCWHPYGLQLLRPEQFTVVVNSILRGQNRLLPVARTHTGSLIVYQPIWPR